LLFKTDNLNSPLGTYEGCTYALLSNAHINLAFSNDSKHLAFRWKKTVRVVSTETLKIVAEYENKRKVIAILYSPDSNFMAVCGGTKISFYDLNKDSSVAFIKEVDGCCNKVFYADRN